MHLNTLIKSECRELVSAHNVRQLLDVLSLFLDKLAGDRSDGAHTVSPVDSRPCGVYFESPFHLRRTHNIVDPLHDFLILKLHQSLRRETPRCARGERRSRQAAVPRETGWEYWFSVMSRVVL